MDGTVLSQGTFTSNGAATIIQIPANADFMWVRNFTKSGAAGSTAPAYGTSYYWQRGMAAGSAILSYKTNALLTDNTDTIALGGFTLYDPSINQPPIVGPKIAVTAVTNATQPVVTIASTVGLAVGMIIRLENTGQSDINGVDMVISAINVNGTDFTLLFNAAADRNLLATAPGAAVITAGAAGSGMRVIQYPLFYARKLVITNFGTLNGVANSVATSVAHGFAAGQRVRFQIPSVSGSVELNSNSFNNYQTFTVQAVTSDYNFTIIPNGAVSAFAYPTALQVAAGAQLPIVVPVGEDTANALVNLNAQVPMIGGIQIANTQTGILSDATVNTGFLGMILGTGGTALALNDAVSGPAGVNNDVMYWVAGKSAFGGL